MSYDWKNIGGRYLRMLICLTLFLSILGFCGCIAQDPERLFVEGHALQERGDFKNAIGAYERLLYLFPDYENISKVKEITNLSFISGE